VRSHQVTAALSEELPREVSGLHCIRDAAQKISRIFKETSPRHKMKPRWGMKKGITEGSGRGYKLAEGGSWMPVTSGNRNKAVSSFTCA